jgi:hypothetical protein
MQIKKTKEIKMEHIEIQLRNNMRFNWKNPKWNNILCVGLIIIVVIVLNKIL